VVAAALVVLAYLLGTFPTALLVGRRRGFDPTTAGSGNPGASNAFRVGGARAGAVVFVGDAAKGALAAGVGLGVGGRALAFAMGVAAVVGHIAPATRRFRGGKGVATAFGMAIVVLPVAVPVAAIAFVVGLRVGQAAAVGSLCAVIAVVVMFPLAGRPAWEAWMAAVVALLIVARHRGNLAQLRDRARPTGSHDR
jgi:glycerol-3-phosphate acyltransferase PlsY